MNQRKNAALVIIDLQNDYFEGGKYPLWNSEQVLRKIEEVIHKAQQLAMPIILVQHIADNRHGLAPFFNEGTAGVEIHSSIQKAVADADIVVKHYADSFEQTDFKQILEKHSIDELLICGMMTQNCVTHTAISKSAENYKVTILADCCTTVDEMLNNIALHALSTRVEILPAEQLMQFS